MFDIKSVESEARQELADEKSKDAKAKIKAKLKQIAAAEAVLRNLRSEYDVLLREVAGA